MTYTKFSTMYNTANSSLNGVTIPDIRDHGEGSIEGVWGRAGMRET